MSAMLSKLRLLGLCVAEPPMAPYYGLRMVDGERRRPRVPRDGEGQGQTLGGICEAHLALSPSMLGSGLELRAFGSA